MTLTRMILGVALVTALPSPASASPATPEGVPPFSVGMAVTEAPKAGAPIEVRVVVSGRYAEGSVARVDLELSPGIEVIEGPTQLDVRDWSRPTFQTVTVRLPEAGDPVVKARIRVDSPMGIADEGEYVLRLSDVPREGEPIVSRPVRLERVDRGQRYRYAGLFRVPIAGPENFVQDDLSARGAKPSVLQSFKAECRTCTQALPEAVGFVVFLDEQGRITDLRALDAKLETAAVAEARTALARWRFQPARLGGRAVPDFLVVQLGFSQK